MSLEESYVRCWDNHISENRWIKALLPGECKHFWGQKGQKASKDGTEWLACQKLRLRKRLLRKNRSPGVVSLVFISSPQTHTLFLLWGCRQVFCFVTPLPTKPAVHWACFYFYCSGQRILEEVKVVYKLFLAPMRTLNVFGPFIPKFKVWEIVENEKKKVFF